MGNQKKIFSDLELEVLWNSFKTVPINPDTERLEESWNEFNKGTSKWTVLKWFDKRYSKGVGALALS